MKKIIKYCALTALALAGVFLFATATSASETSFRANDWYQRIEMTTTMETATRPYAMYPLGYIITITSAGDTRRVFLEGPYYTPGTGYRIPYSDIISEFQTEHGSAGRTQAENYFYNYSGILTLDTVMTLWSRNANVYSGYSDYRLLLNDRLGYVQAKINDTNHVSDPGKEVPFSNWSSHMKVFPIQKFWNWSQKSYAWSYYATWMNNARTSTYTLTPSTFTSNTVRYYNAPNFASNWQDAAMMCEFDQNSIYAIREYYKRTITRTNPKNFSAGIESVSSTTAFEGQPVTVTVNWKNHSPTFHTNVPVQIYRAGILVASENLTFWPMHTLQRSYTVNMGFGTGLRNIQARINWDERFTESNPNDNIAHTFVWVSELYEFSISNLEVTPSTVLQNGTVNISFITDNWNATRSYSDIPVEVLHNGEVLFTDYVSFSPYGQNSHNYTLNVGSELGTRTISARINWDNRQNEIDPDNNITPEKTFTVLPMTNLSIEFLDPGAHYREGTQVISTFKVTNQGFMHMIPSNELSVRFVAYFMNAQMMPVVVRVKERHEVVIPAGSDNIAHFKWTVPNATAGNDLRINAIVDPANRIAESDTTDNSVTVQRNVLPKEVFSTPNTQFEKSAPTGFQLLPAPGVPPVQSAVWSKWEWVNGWFSRRHYGLRIDNMHRPAIKPDISVPTRRQVAGVWQMGSGYGFNLDFELVLSVHTSHVFPPEDAFTPVQTVELLFPEFMYADSPAKKRSLNQVSPGVFSLYPNPYSINDAKVHYTPVWFPDTDYIVRAVLSDIWTPAGMLTGRLDSNPIRIRGSIYDDWYVGR